MKGYITELLIKHDSPKPHRAQHSPHAHHDIVYGAKEQLLPDVDTSPPLDNASIDDAGVKQVKGIVGSLLY